MSSARLYVAVGRYLNRKPSIHVWYRLCLQERLDRGQPSLVWRDYAVRAVVPRG